MICIVGFSYNAVFYLGMENLSVGMGMQSMVVGDVKRKSGQESIKWLSPNSVYSYVSLSAC